MKKFLFIFLVILTATSCNKTKFAPEGPTDIRVKNISDQNFVEVIVDIDGKRDTLGNIASQNYSEYSQFEKAYPKAEISAKINGETYSTGPVVYTYLTYIGQERITYVVWISDPSNKKLEIDDVIYEEPLVLK